MRRTYRHITSLELLRAERYKMKASYEHQGELLKANAGAYIKQYNPVYLFKKYFTRDNFEKIDHEANISGKAMSLILPLFLNKTLFKGSGFLTKAIISFASNRIGRKLDFDHLTGMAEKVKNWFKSRAPRKPKVVDYGIPPDSETY